jgi:hypothetical protein
VAIHLGELPVNHGHLLATPSKANLPAFVGQVHSESSKALKTLMARERYDAPGSVWDKRDPHYLRLMDVPAQVAGSQYVRMNCVAAGLVARPEHMPGVQVGFDAWKTGYIEVKKPSFYFSPERPDILTIEVTPPPLLYEAFDGDIDAIVEHMKRLQREQVARVTALRKRGPLGAQRLQRLHPWDEPKTLRERGGQRVPTFRYGARGKERVQRDVEGAREVGRFHRTHHQVRIDHRDGNRTRAYPYGTYKERVIHGAPVDPVPQEGNAAIAMPGPTLADIKAKLAARETVPDPSEVAARHEALLTEAKTIVDEELADIVADETDAVGDFRQSAKDRNVVVRHRFAHNPPEAGSGVARVIVKRDRRTGRPAAAHSKHGADPPT